METVNHVDTTIGRLSYQLNLKLSLSLGSLSMDKMELEKSTRKFYQINLKRQITMTQQPLGTHVQGLKWENCAIKIFVDSADGDEHFSKWLHLDGKAGSWKDFISEAKYDKLFLDKEMKLRSVSWEIVVFGRVYIRVKDKNGSDMKIPINRTIIDHAVRMSVVQTNIIPCAWSSFDSQDSTAILAIEGRPEEKVLANKFLLAAYSPVLRKMLFEVDMKEKESGCINLSDTSFLALKTFIGLLSDDKATGSDIVEMSADVIFEVLALAHKYQVDGIIDLCTMIVMAKADFEMEISEVHHLFKVGKLYGISDLCTRSFEWIRRSSLNAEKWDEIFVFLNKEAKDLFSEYCYYFTMYTMSCVYTTLDGTIFSF